MICPICRADIPDNSGFCGRCGNRISRCPTCGTVVEEASRFCVVDGTLLPDDVLSLLPARSSIGPSGLKVSAGSAMSLSNAPTWQFGTDDASAASAGPRADAGATRPFEVIDARPADWAEPAGAAASGPSERDYFRRDAETDGLAGPRRFCIQCGGQCRPGQTYCDRCQMQNDQTIPYRVQRTRPAQAETAPAQAAAPKQYCAHCGNPCREGQKYCDSCLALIEQAMLLRRQQEQAEAAAAAPVSYCAQCGKPCGAGEKYCADCLNAMQVAQKRPESAPAAEQPPEPEPAAEQLPEPKPAAEQPPEPEPAAEQPPEPEPAAEQPPEPESKPAERPEEKTGHGFTVFLVIIIVLLAAALIGGVVYMLMTGEFQKIVDAIGQSDLFS